MKIKLVMSLTSLLLIIGCGKQSYPSISSKSHRSWTAYNCVDYKELNLSASQRRKLNAGAKRRFKSKENLKDFCYTIEVSEKKFGLVEGIRFSSHPSRLLFIFSEKHLEVLKSEKKSLNLIDSFELKIKRFEDEFDSSTIEKMRAYVSNYYK